MRVLAASGVGFRETSLRRAIFVPGLSFSSHSENPEERGTPPERSPPPLVLPSTPQLPLAKLLEAVAGGPMPTNCRASGIERIFSPERYTPMIEARACKASPTARG